MKKKLTIVNQHLKFQKVSLVEPAKSFYLHIAAEIDRSPLPFFLTASAKKKRIIEQSKKWCDELKKDKNVISAVVFKARLIPPGKGKFVEERKDKGQIERFDLAILIEANSLETIKNIKQSHAFREIEKSLKTVSIATHIITATNIKHINPVNHEKEGVFLFNYFFADDLQQNLEVWEYTAGWFQQETGLDNSTVLLPSDQQKSKYTIINHCRWDKLRDILPSLIFKKSFHSYVLDNFYVNKVAAMPILYQLA